MDKTGDESSNKTNIKLIIKVATGNFIEWYDFYVYAATSMYFASQIFPSNGDKVVELLKSASVFFIGFIMRPVGAWVFGSLADKKGRKTSILIAVALMGIASFLTSILPTYDQIGAWSAFFLAIFRMMQGLSAGGQYGSIAAYISESSAKKHICFHAAFQAMTLVVGMLIASVVVSILGYIITDTQFQNWGWRIPFFIGGIISIYGYYLQATLNENIHKNPSKSKTKGSIVKLFTEYRKTFILVSGYTAAGSLTFYTYTTYMRSYLYTTTGFDKNTAQTIVAISLFVYMACLPAFGKLADKIGTRACLRWWAGISIFTVIPLLTIIGHTHSKYIAIGCIIILLLTSSLYYAVSNIVKAEMYPTEIRALGTSLSHAVANAIFGGSASMVALYLKDIGYGEVFKYYVTFMLIIAAISAWLMPDAREYSDLYKK